MPLSNYTSVKDNPNSKGRPIVKVIVIVGIYFNIVPESPGLLIHSHSA